MASISTTELASVYKPSFLLLFVLPLLIVLYVLWRVYSGFTGPLAHVPGPLVSKFTNLQLKINVLQGERVRYVHALHEQYGPVVRISPDEVSVADIGAAKSIYKIGGAWKKTEWYDHFTGNQDERSIFSMTDIRKHGQHRRVLAHNFTEKWITNMEPYISKNVKLAVQRMSEQSDEQGHFDIFKWFTSMATDVIGESSFGESFRTLETGKKSQYIHDLEKVANFGTIRAEFPSFFSIVRQLPFGPRKEIVRIVQRLQEYSEESIERYWRLYQEDPENVKPTLMTKDYAGVEQGTIDIAQIRRDGVGFIVAGTDTTAITATYAVWLLLHHPAIEQDLIQEVSKLPVDFKDEDLRSLSLLGNVINETLRLCGPVGQSLPRFVPSGGVDFGGFYIPEGKIAGVPAYTMHRDPTVWSSPERFDPSRWNEPTKDMRDSFYPFGGGSRICIGSHFAELELRHALTNFYRTFEDGVKMSSVEGFSEDDMTPKSYFLSPPKGTRCLVERRK